MSQFGREEQELCDAYNRGDISLAEYNKAMQELQRDYRDAAREAAEEAYRQEMERW